MKLFTNPTLFEVMKGFMNSTYRTRYSNFKRTFRTVSYVNPFQKIPDVSDFEIKLGKEDPIAKKYGIDKKFKPLLKFIPYSNKSLNRYMQHQVRRLNNSRSKPRKFWAIGQQLMEKSNVFLVTGINHLYPQWQRKQSLKEVFRVIRAYKKIIDNNRMDLDYRRVYIEKSGGRFRPLGVPKPEWRLYLHNLNQLLVIFLYHHIPFSQHAFRPKKGCQTAWKQIMTKRVLHSKYIYEFDLKGFFDNVSIQYITHRLLALGVPPLLCLKIQAINRTAPQLPKERKLDESKVERVWRESEIDYKGARAFIDGFKGIPSSMKDNRHFLQSMWYQWNNGVPQGAPTSPLLAILALHPMWQKLKYWDVKAGLIMYADDGIFYSDQPFFDLDKWGPCAIETPKMLKAGIEISYEKSGWVKVKGEWKKPLKFLGLTYDGITDTLQAETRKGSRLEMDKDTMIQEIIKRDEEDPEILKLLELANSKYEVKWEAYMKSKIWGLIHSRLYSGAWRMKDFKQDFTYRFVRNSWSDVKGSLDNDLTIFNSSSIASKWLVNVLTSRYHKWARNPGRSPVRPRIRWS